MAQKYYLSRGRSGSHREERREYRHKDYSRSPRKRRRYNDYEGERGQYHDDYRGASSHYDSYNHDSQHRYHEKYDSYSHKKSRRHHSHSSSDSEDSYIPSWDDGERHYKIYLGESLIPRYKILSEMGEGTFGRVVECWDRHLKKRVAVKIVRAIEKYRDAAKLEIEVLETLQRYDPYYDQPLIQMTSWFDFRGHICMVFEKHGLSLYDFMQKNSFRPFSVTHVREIGYQLLHSISFLHSLTLIHTDLKPENILFVDSMFDYVTPPHNPETEFSPAPLRVPRDTSIKLIDFGSATFSHRYHTTVVSTRHYRAPEVILGMGWSYPCDIWSIGCILLQLYSGDALFQTRENREHLAMMEKVFGEFPEYLVDRAERCSGSIQSVSSTAPSMSPLLYLPFLFPSLPIVSFFLPKHEDRPLGLDGQGLWEYFIDSTNRHSQKYFQRGRVVFPADDVTSSHERAKQLAYVKYMRRLEDYLAPEDDQLLNLLFKIFEYDPNKRISARNALKHPFFDKVRDKYKYQPFGSSYK